MTPERFQAIRKEALANIAIREAVEATAAATPGERPPAIHGAFVRFSSIAQFMTFLDRYCRQPPAG